jgi:hypothetical protein
MAQYDRANPGRSAHASERMAREVFFAMLGATSVSLLLGLAAVGHFMS